MGRLTNRNLVNTSTTSAEVLLSDWRPVDNTGPLLTFFDSVVVFVTIIVYIKTGRIRCQLAKKVFLEDECVS